VNLFGPKERTIDASRLDAIADELDAVASGEDRLLVKRDGKVVGAVVSLEELAMIRRTRREQKRRLEPIFNVARHFADVPTDVLEREVANAVAEAKAELYGESRRAELD
jgi:hypothetical protein